MTAVPPPPESQLIHARREAMTPKTSMRKAAQLAGISPERWRQVETGVARVGRGIDVPVTDVPADTVARMAHAVGATPAELESCGRPDAAAILSQMLSADAAASGLTDREMLLDLARRLGELEQHFSHAEGEGDNDKTNGGRRAG